MDREREETSLRSANAGTVVGFRLLSRSPRKIPYRCSLLPHSAAVTPAVDITFHSFTDHLRRIRTRL